ncbi:5-formyltetrahydrofolate cyclo-ligase [Notoacmeibacter sp. MSK16QG-6]|uniref:5-formyltetrahydrofolate cyclo-ligase n=1 Tax=Notoacmeibacter sp. MSK16QG-6 TaxID=2957982 RepID=UPI00209CB219|nr:5-formyltetrahydrofolate cyclo-ligase [Notoacmeibacter sp. MSK16QG-6]MCP1200146.1 5-formyltetrahydrofolate cyclo-ligase [Notoacmeibacter sp. MSK16QG-6]
MKQSDKSQLRAEALEKRDGLDPVFRIECASAIAAHAGGIDLNHGEIVAGYMPIRSEIDPRPLMHALMARGARLCLPAVIDRTTIVFREMIKGEPLIETGFGTVGPGPDASELKPDTILMPLAGFDAAGNRLGYGAGHYDRAIARLRKAGLSPRLIGLAFAGQECGAIEAEGHDVPLDLVVTENGLRGFDSHA